MPSLNYLTPNPFTPQTAPPSSTKTTSPSTRSPTYSIALGPVFLDRDEKGDLHQYYAREFLLNKRDSDGQWMSARQADGDQAKILPALFSSGSIGDLNDTDQKKGGLVLEEVEKVVLRVGIRGVADSETGVIHSDRI